MGFMRPEFLVIIVVALLIFGPKKLPEMGSAIGKSITQFKRGMSDAEHTKEEEELNQSAAAKLELEAIEREIASKKAALAAQESAEPEVSLHTADTVEQKYQ